jgi:hypothetical protein
MMTEQKGIDFNVQVVSMVQHRLQCVQFCNQTCPLEITFQKDLSLPGAMKRLMLAMPLAKTSPKCPFRPCKKLSWLPVYSQFISFGAKPSIGGPILGNLKTVNVLCKNVSPRIADGTFGPAIG